MNTVVLLLGHVAKANVYMYMYTAIHPLSLCMWVVGMYAIGILSNCPMAVMVMG